MKRFLRIARYSLRYPTYIIFGLISLVFYAAFSGVSITLVIPIFDNIFMGDRSVEVVNFHLGEFFLAMKGMVAWFIQSNGFSFSSRYLDGLWVELKQILSQTEPWLLLQVVCTVLVIILLAKNLFFYLHKLMFVNLQGKSIRDIRNDCYKNYLSQNYSFFNQNREGDSVVRMINDIEAINGLLVGSIFNILKEVFEVLVYVMIAWSLNIRLFLISMLILPIFILSVNILSRKIRKHAKRNLNELSSMFSRIIEVLHNMRIVKAFCKENYEYQQQISVNNAFFQSWRRVQIYTIFGHPISEISSMLIGIVILFIGSAAILGSESSFSFGDFTAFLFAVFSMMHPLKQLASDITSIRRATVSLDRVCEILELHSDISDSDTSVEKKDFCDKIEFAGVNFSYVDDKPVLKDCNITIGRGQKVALVGSSGSGKTTIANLINRMYDVSSGAVYLDGINIKEIKISSLRKLFGVVTQDSILFSDTIARNIMYGSSSEQSLEVIKTACHFAYADEFIDQLPEGYDTPILPQGSNLSGGQKQRLCIARAIIDNPPILIFDEATSALDTDSEQKVQKAIDMAAGNRTVIIIAHRLSTILSADKIYVIDKGKVIGAGTHSELLESCEVYRHFYELQFQK